MATTENPYTPRVLKLSADLESLRKAPPAQMFSEEELRQRLAQQQRAEQMAMLAKLSGNKELMSVGAALLPEALKARSPKVIDHGEYDPLKGQLRVFPEFARRREEDVLARNLANAEAARDAHAARMQAQDDRQAALDPYNKARIEALEEATRYRKLQTELKSQERARGKPLVGMAYKNMVAAGEEVDAADKISLSLKKEFNTETSQGITVLGEFQDRIARAIPGFAPDSWIKNNRAWASLQRLRELKERHEKFGATLTPNEKISWDAVTPPRGAEREELDAWINEQNALIKRAIAYEAEGLAAAGYSKEQLELFTRGVYKRKKVMMYDPATGTFQEVNE